MFNVIFYKFDKRFNSTKRPEADALLTMRTRCHILNGTGVINPKIELDIGLTENPSQYNFCFINDFNRYYYVREWFFDAGKWIAFLNVDVLATYRNRIGSQNLYILRAANDYDGRIMDGLYPVKSGCDYARNTVNSPYSSINAGCFVIGVVSKYGNFGSLTYHAMTAAELATLSAALIEDPSSLINSTYGFSLNDASAALQVQLIDPIQYIKSCVWLPFAASEIPGTDIPASGPTGGIDIYNWHLNVSHRIISNNGPHINITKSFGLTKHPDTSSRGNYVNCAPYTVATLSFPPFGVIELDTSVLCDASGLNAQLIIDALTGRGTIILKANNTIMNRLESQVGVPIQLSQVTRDFLGAASNILGSVGNIASAIMNPAGAVGGIIGAGQGIINAVEAMCPRANTIGSGGGFSHLQGTFEIDWQFFRPVNDDLTHNGRPLCQKRRPRDLGGYMLVQDADVPTTGTRAEDEQITAFLQGGFYWE